MSAQFPPQPPTSPSNQPPPAPPAQQSAGKMLAIVAAVVAAAMALAGGIYAMTRSDSSTSVSSDSVTTEPISSSVTEPPATEPPVTEPPVTEPLVTEPPVTEPPVTEPTVTAPAVTDPAVTTSDAPSVTEPDPDELTTINQLLAWTSFSEDPLDAVSQQADIDRLISDRTLDAVAHPTRVSTICAGIPVNAAIDLNIVWQFAGDTVQSDAFAATPPGVGSCIDNDGDPLDAGSYQVLASNDDASVVGLATTFVVGAGEITQSFVNNSDQDICEVGVAPVDTAYYELFVVEGGALAPGELLEITIASVEQDLLARTCDSSDLGELSFFPDGFGTQNLVP